MITFFPPSPRNKTLFGAFVALWAGFAIAQDSVELSDVVEIAATVTAVDEAQRLVTLRGPEGNEIAFEASPDVRNFGQIEVGDVVRLSYEARYTATRVDPDELPEVAAAAAAGAARAAEGERPGAAIGVVESMIVLIESIGPDGRTATFITPEGALQAIYVEREEGRAFARSLAAGDLVELTVAEAVALVVEPIGE